MEHCRNETELNAARVSGGVGDSSDGLVEAIHAQPVLNPPVISSDARDTNTNATTTTSGNIINNIRSHAPDVDEKKAALSSFASSVLRHTNPPRSLTLPINFQPPAVVSFEVTNSASFHHPSSSSTRESPRYQSSVHPLSMMNLPFNLHHEGDSLQSPNIHDGTMNFIPKHIT